MPQIDMTITISVIVALASVLSPILTALINNKHQLKMKKLELKQKEYEQTVIYKRTIFENYLKGLSLVAHNPNAKNLSLYSEYYPLAYMYLPKEIQDIMAEVNLMIGRPSLATEPIKYVDLITSHIHTELQKL